MTLYKLEKFLRTLAANLPDSHIFDRYNLENLADSVKYAPEKYHKALMALNKNGG